MFPLFIVKHSHYVSRTAKLFIYLFTYLCLHLLLPESLDVNSEQVITEREMEPTIDAMNSLPLKKKKRIQVKETPKHHAFKARTLKAITLVFEASWNGL